MNENDKAKAATIIDRLYDRTSVGKINWMESPDKNSFYTNIGDHTIQIMQDYDPEGDYTYYKVELRRDDGALIDEIHAGFIYDIIPKSDPSLKFGQILENIYESARRYALGVDKAYDDILSHLK